MIVADDVAHELELARKLVDRYFSPSDTELLMGNRSIAEIASRVSTPLFAYSSAACDAQFDRLRQAIPPVIEVYYSVKANPSLAMIRHLVQRGCGVEVASPGEILLALAAGCPANRIVYAGPGKTDAELRYALEHEIEAIHIESFGEARRLSALAAAMRTRAPVVVRVNPNASVQGGAMRMGGRPAPFGVDEEQLVDWLAAIQSLPSLEWKGIHVYAGTQNLDASALLAQYGHVLMLAEKAAACMRKPIQVLDIGGGLGVPYFSHDGELDMDQLAAGLQALVDRAGNSPWLAGTRWILELGRFLVAPAGVYVTRVVDVKQSRGKTFVILDGGMHHHLAASGNLGQTIKRNFPVAVLNKLREPAANAVDLVGPLCTPLDTLARSVRLPAVVPGDLVGVFQSRAYARTASPLGFLSHPAPPEVWIQQGQDYLVRRRDDLISMLHQQSLPDLAADPDL